MNLDNIFFSSLFNNLDIGIIISDSNLNIININDFMKNNFFGFDKVNDISLEIFLKEFQSEKNYDQSNIIDENLYNIVVLALEENIVINKLCFIKSLTDSDTFDKKFFSVCFKPLLEGDKKLALITFYNLTDFKILEKEYIENQIKTKSIIHNISLGYAYSKLEQDINGNPCDFVFLETNTAFEKITGLKAQEIIGKSIKQIQPDFDQNQLNVFNEVAFYGAKRQIKDFSFLLNKFTNVDVFSFKKGYFTFILSDNAEKNEVNIIAEHSINRLKGFINNAPDGVFVIDKEAKFLEANIAAGVITGFPKEELKRLKLYDLTPPEYHNYLKGAINALISSGSNTMELEFIRKDEKRRFWNIDSVKISENEYISFHKDITEKKLIQEKLQYNCYHDHVTGLFNRRYITKLINEYEKNIDLYPMSIIVGDINGVKVVNDAFGRFAGDSLIKRMAEIVSDVCDKNDIIGKWGGDEFIIFSPNSNIGKIHETITKIKTECEKSTHNIKLSISFGFSIKMTKQENFDDILKTAENMMLKNKIYEGASFRSQTINIILNTLHEKNKREEQHSVRVSQICVEIGKAMNLTQNDINKLKVIGLMHDIGKIGISESILNKVGMLTEYEFDEIKKHSEIGYRILSSSNQTSELAQDVLDHHERYDGNGYPNGTPGNKLSTMAKTLAIADSYDAMTSNRPYKNAMTKSEAIAELIKHSARQFDPYIVDVFINKVLISTTEI